MKKNDKKNLNALKAFGVLAGLLILVGVIWWFIDSGMLQLNFRSPEVSKPNNEITGQTAVDMALVKAREWQADAVLSYMNSDEVNGSGTASTWRLIFISQSIKDKGYEIKIYNRQVISAEEISYVGNGEEFPAETIITEERAVEMVKKMPGYENAEILGVDAVYGQGTKTWYWGVKTDKGVVSIEAKKK